MLVIELIPKAQALLKVTSRKMLPSHEAIPGGLTIKGKDALELSDGRVARTNVAGVSVILPALLLHTQFMTPSLCSIMLSISSTLGSKSAGRSRGGGSCRYRTLNVVVENSRNPSAWSQK